MLDTDGMIKLGQEAVYWWCYLQKCGQSKENCKPQGSTPGLVAVRVYSISMPKPEGVREEHLGKPVDRGLLEEELSPSFGDLRDPQQ